MRQAKPARHTPPRYCKQQATGACTSRTSAGARSCWPDSDCCTHEAGGLERDRVVGQGLRGEATHDCHSLPADALLTEVAQVADGVVFVELLSLLRAVVEADLGL